MTMITTRDYAEIANRVYQIDANKDGLDDAAPSQGDDTHSPWCYKGFICRLFKYGMGWGDTKTDFKGCVYVNESLGKSVVAIQGTKFSKLGDTVSDIQIAVGMITGMMPQYCSAALKLFERTREGFPHYPLFLVGHSLGGAMAQVIGQWTGIPFVTFNAPGMWSNIQASKVFLGWNPADTLRSIKGTFTGPLLAKQRAGTGRNFRNVSDLVSSFGSHYGPVTRFWSASTPLKAHSMDEMLRLVVHSHWAGKDPLDVANKEWGELG
jgi:hypothetical protein